MRPDVDIKQIERFLGIVDAGSFTAAAKAVGIAQTALSREVRILEESIGIQLLHRHGRGVRLTADGQSYVEVIRPIIRDFARVKNSIVEAEHPITGEARAGMGITMTAAIVSEVASAFRRDFPGVRLRLEFVDSLLRKLLNNELDVVVTSNADSVPSLNVSNLLRANLYLMGPERQLRALARDEFTIEASALEGLPLIIVVHSHGLRYELGLIGSAHGFEPNIVIELSSQDAIHRLMEQGLGFTVLPYTRAMVENFSPNLGIRQIVNPSLAITFQLAYPRHRMPTAAILRLETILRRAITEAVADGRLRGEILSH